MTPPGGSSRPLALAIFLALGLVLLAGAWSGWHLIGAKDWNYFLGQTQAEVASIEQGQLPLWAPWRRGGQVSFAQPESMLLSPVTPLALAFGTLAGFKLLLLPVHLLGCLGLWMLAGQLGLAGRARLVPSLLFFGCSIFPLFVVAGLPNWLCAMAILPWMLWAWRRAQDDARWAPLAGLLWAGTLFCGGIYQFVFFPLLLAGDALLLAAARRSARPLAMLAVVGLCGALLAAPRLLPVAEVYAQYPRHVSAEEDQLLVSLLPDIWLRRELPDLTSTKGPLIVTPEGGTYWIYAGAYMGPLALALAALGLLRWRRTLPWLLLGGGFVWMALGSHANPSLWTALHSLPVYGSMHSPQRLALFASFCLALVAGFGFALVEDALARRGTARLARAGPWLLVVALVVPMLLVNAPIARHAFVLEPGWLHATGVLPRPGGAGAGAPPREFFQDFVPRRPEQWGGETFESTLANVGNVDAFSDVPTPRPARAISDPDYRGEVYLLEGGGSIEARVTPNRITVRARLDGPDTLVVNQNWYPGWVAERAPGAGVRSGGDRDGGAGSREAGSGSVALVAHEDLLSLPLPAGEHALVLRYRPRSVVRGAAIGAGALLLGGAWLWMRRRGAPARLRARDVLALTGAAALALAFAASLPALPDRPPERAPPVHPVIASARLVEPGPASLQQAVDAAPPGSMLVLAPGAHGGARFTRGLHVAAQPGGAIRFTGPLVVEGLPAGEQLDLVGTAADGLRADDVVLRDCAGLVALQSLRAARLTAERCGAVYLVECEIGSRAEQQARIIEMPPRQAASAAPPHLSVMHSRYMGRSITIEMSGRPGARGALLVGTELVEGGALEPFGIALDLSVQHSLLPLTIPESGRLTLRTKIPAARVAPGRGAFAQLVLESAPGSGQPLVSPLAGRLFELGGR